MEEKKKIKFIRWSIFFLFVLLISSYIFNLNSVEASSVQPEINAINECIIVKNKKDKKLISLVDSIQKSVKYKNGKAITDSSKINSNLKALKQEFKGSNNKTIIDLISKIEKKVNIYESKTTTENKNNWWEIIFSWQFIAIYLIIALVYFNFTLNNIFGGFGKVKSLNILGNGIEFGEEVKINTELSIKQYRTRIKEIFSYQIQKEQLNDKLRYFVEDIKGHLATEKNLDKSDIKLRCTIHIQDILFQETLYQLLDYYPVSQSKGSGRIKSIRFGIVGLAWRTEESKVRGNIDNHQNQLIKDWGLDITESTSGGSLKSFAAILLKSAEGTRLGVIYLDSPIENLFGDSNVDGLKSEAEDFENFVRAKCKEKSIQSSLITIQDNLADKFLQIRIYE